MTKWTDIPLAFGIALGVGMRFLLLLIAQILTSAEFYVSPNGLAGGVGSLSAPWNLATALAHPATVRPGDVINLRAGTYKAPAIGTYFISRLCGAAPQYITVRPYGVERVVIDGGFQIVGPSVIFRDLEVFSSDPRRVSQQPGTWPNDVNQFVSFLVYAPNVKLINNVLHDNAGGISGWKEATDNEYSGNIIYYNGWQQGQFNAHGHGLYVQNDQGFKKITDNIVFSQFDHGIHAYGSDSAPLNNIQIDGNISFGNGTLGLYYSRNVLVGGGSSINNLLLTNNYAYFPPASTLGGENRIGRATGCANLKMTGNYFVGNGYTLAFEGCGISAMSGNTFYGPTLAFPSAHIPSNTFHPLANAPNDVRVFVRPNAYEVGRANIVIFNWNRKTFVGVDVSSVGLAVGDSYEVRDVQNFLGNPVVSGVYAGSPVAIPLTATAVTPAVGNVPYPPRHTDPEFQVFVIRKLGAVIPPAIPPPIVIPPPVVVPPPVVPPLVPTQAYYEAESGLLESPMFILDWSIASGGKYVRSNTTNKGRASLTIQIPTAGVYVAWGRILSGNGNMDSFWVSVDGGPEDLWDTAQGLWKNAWQWTRVTGRNANGGVPSPKNVKPRLFTLTPGSHTITFRGADTYTYLDRVVVTNDLAFIP